MRLTNDVLPEAVRRAFVNAQGVVIDLKIDQSRAVVVAASAAAAGAAAAPVPMADAVLLRPIQLGMLAGITAIFGLELSKDQTSGLLKAAVGQGSDGAGGQEARQGAERPRPRRQRDQRRRRRRADGRARRGLRPAVREILRRKAQGKPMPDPEMVEFLMEMYNRLLRRA